jgi:pilus assembly protein CpaC
MRRKVRVLVLILAVFGQTRLYAQAPAFASVASAGASAPNDVVDVDTSAVRLLAGRSTLVNVPSPIARVSLTSAEVADALVTSPSQLLINGKLPGTISMFVWDRGGTIRRYEVIVQRDLARLAEQMKQLFPSEAIDVRGNGKNVVLSGIVSSKEVADKAMSVAGGYVDKRDEVVSLLQVQQGAVSNQVLLRVRFAEVSRSVLTEAGLSLITGAAGYKNYLARSTTQQFPAPDFFQNVPAVPPDKLVFSDFLNLFLFNTKENLGAVLKALQDRGLFQSLAEPNLVAESGKEASFLAGGEFPIPVAQGSGANLAISVQFKEFGVRLNFTPTVTGDRIHLKVRPEVSTLDFNNAVMLQGFRIPALSTRRTETELELQDHQTFAIAGLINNTMNKSLQKIPGIGDIPILGLLFKSVASQKNQTELVVMITPEILPSNSPGVAAQLPRMNEKYLEPPAEKKLVEPPPPAFLPAPRPSGSSSAQPVPVPAPATAARAPEGTDPAKAAAAVQALTPGVKRINEAEIAPAPAPANANEVAASEVSRPLTKEEKKAIEHARAQEYEAHQAEMKRLEKQAAEEKRRQERQAAEDRRKAEEQQKAEQEAQERAAREQAKRDAEAAKQAAEVAERQAERDRKQEKARAEAAAKVKAAEDEYQAELAKRPRQEQ